MRRSYSRLSSVEEKRNIRKAFLYGILTLASLALIFFFGLPILVRFAGLLTDLAKSERPVEIADTTPPAPPRINSLPEATNQYTIDVTGVAEAGVDVIISFNQKEETVLADKSGNFTANFPLNKGENTVSAIARDQAGNESQRTQVYKILFDNEDPQIEIIQPIDGSSFFGPKQKDLTISGKTESGSQVTINDRFVTVNEDGSFTSVTYLSEGENTFNIKSIDKAGNTSEKSLTVSYSP